MKVKGFSKLKLLLVFTIIAAIILSVGILSIRIFAGEDSSIPAPSQLELEQKMDSTIKLKWFFPYGPAQDFIDSFDIYDNGILVASKSPYVGNTSTIRHTLTGMDPKVNHYFTVKCKKGTNTSLESNAVSVAVVNAPINLIASKSGSKVSLTWSFTYGVAYNYTDSFEVYDNDVLVGSQSPYGGNTSTFNYSISDVDTSVTHNYTVRCRKGQNYSLATNKAVVTNTYSSGVDTNPIIWFNPETAVNYVIVHYKINSEGQQNVRMTNDNGSWKNFISTVNPGSVVDFSFTYQNTAGFQYDTAWVSQVQP